MSDEPAPPLEPWQVMAENCDVITSVIPWGRRLSFRITKVEKGHVWGIQPWKDRLVGDPDTGVIHGGVLTGFLDNLCGPAAMSALSTPHYVATLDLRIDYLKPARPPEAVIAHAECFKVTRSIAFARGLAYHEDAPDDPIASVAATFIRKAAE